MKRLGITLSLLTVLLNPMFAQSEAGAIFLLNLIKLRLLLPIYENDE